MRTERPSEQKNIKDTAPARIKKKKIGPVILVRTERPGEHLNTKDLKDTVDR